MNKTAAEDLIFRVWSQTTYSPIKVFLVWDQVSGCIIRSIDSLDNLFRNCKSCLTKRRVCSSKTLKREWFVASDSQLFFSVLKE